MRGPISLAAAPSIPRMANAAMPQFDALVFITAIVIAVTLVVQGIRLGEAESGAGGDGEAVGVGARGAGDARDGGEPSPILQGRTEGAEQAGGVLRLMLDAERSRVHALGREGRIHDRALERVGRALDVRERAVA